MKKIIGIFLAAIMVFASVPSFAAEDFFSGQDTLDIVFLGGSVTEGSGSPQAWVNVIGQKFQERFSDKTVRYYNAGVGGTGSDFGLFRLRRDVSLYHPDIVFVDFAGNDRYTSFEDSQKHMEGIVRQLMQLPKPPVIIFVYAASEITLQRPNIPAHQSVADYYGIPSINIDDYFQNTVLASGDKTREDYLPDKIHPNDLGNQMYADFIWKTISENEEEYFKVPKMQDTPLSGYEFTKPQLMPFHEGTFTGEWKEVSTTQVRRARSATETSEEGATATFHFSGTTFGIIAQQRADGGVLSYSIDGGPIQTCSLKADPDYVSGPTKYVTNLPDGDHTVVFTNPKDNISNIAYIMVDQEEEVDHIEKVEQSANVKVYTLTDSNYSQSSDSQWLTSPSLLGYNDTATNYSSVNTDKSWMQWTIPDQGTFDVAFWRVCHPTAGTEFLKVEVKHKDGTFVSDRINCVGGISEGGFVSLGEFEFAGDGTEYVKMYLDEGADKKFLRGNSIQLTGLNAPTDPIEQPEEAIKVDQNKVTVTITNSKYQDMENATIICAAFDGGKLYGIKSMLSTLPANSTVTREIDFLYDVSGKDITVFVWDKSSDSTAIVIK